ncbi:mandelate racemase/muconate lactonizing enzyme family protein [Paenibacillus sp. NPDC056722]|uniref:mandelate racemase/muconate lactonizing enzyme family protein n=1 Tax=Paenibacillus sp. NPDC056722 TaxID=3345924 RepID=UPI0036BAACD3
MKITRVTANYYSWPRTRAISNGSHTWSDVVRCVLKIETDEGITGYGIGSASDGERQLREAFAVRLIGMDPLMTERIWSTLWDSKLYGRRGHETAALSSIDMALWDIKSKYAGLPLHRLLGGYTDKMPVYIAGGYYMDGEGITELQREMLSYVELGARAVKMKIGRLTIREDVQRVRAVREAIGPDVTLMVDANASYRYFEAIQMAKRLEEFDLFWLEEPVAPDDYAGYEKIAAHTSITLAAGEQEYTKYGFRDLIETGAVGILQPDARWMGGVTEFRKVAAMAEASGLAISAHGDHQINLPLMASIPCGIWMEYYPAVFDPMLASFYTEGAVLNADGCLQVPEVVGNGCTPDETRLAPYRLKL